jgi:hypothetical protein
MPRDEYPEIQNVPTNRLFAFAWAGIFFVAINLVIWIVFAPIAERPFERFSFSIPYEQMDDVLRTIKADHRPKIIFLGSSVLLGTATPNPADTIPGVFRDLLMKKTGREIAVYNLGYPWARPLDAAILIALFHDPTTFFIMDHNRGNSVPLADAQVRTSPETYIRLHQLLLDYSDELLAFAPEIRTCFKARDIPLPSMRVGGAVPWLRPVTRAIPLVRYKNLINMSLFGKHPLVLAQEFLLQISKVRRGDDIRSLLRIFATPESVIDPSPWHPNDPRTAGFNSDEAAFRTSDMNNCIVEALGTAVERTNTRIVSYITPLNPSLVHQGESLLYQKNTSFLIRLFSKMHAINFDDGSIPTSMFADAIHLTPEGNHIFAARLLESISLDLRAAGILP